jgi:hypothetical protein
MWIRTHDEAHALLQRLEESAECTRKCVRELLDRDDSALAFLAKLKFEHSGCDPLDPKRALNLIEQLNQTFTYKASFQAAEWLLRKHPEHAPLKLNLGTASGTDIESQDGAIAAEVFAAVDPHNNRKLQQDIERLREEPAEWRYVLYISPATDGQQDEYQKDDVRVCRLGCW